MSLAPGTRLGAYEVVSLVGEGGMGQVYRARDTKLNREVALKILPEAFALDSDRIGRFRREAQVLAALNHPHIAQIHGLEEATGRQFLVLELVDGESLDKYIARGPLAVDEALVIAKQMAEALEAAHEKGIIHRDLKPANIVLTRDGQVKVLDFGLAKAIDNANGASRDEMNSPTITSLAMLSSVGVILGTAAYMAPDQARGRAVDKRTDIWAFGCVLFEMLTGRRAFDGADTSTTLAAVLKSEPEWSALPAVVPPSLRRLLARCLQKDPRERVRDIGDARIAIDDVLSGAEVPAPTTIRRAPWWRRVAIRAAMLLVGALIAGVAVWIARPSTVARPRVSVLTISPPDAAALSVNGATRDVAITPDGSHVIYVGANGTTLFVRPLDQLDATPLVRGGALRDPFVSPDGQWVGFFDGLSTLKKVAITGGPPALVAQFNTPTNGATWAADGTIIVATTGLLQVSADGGEPTVLTRPDHAREEAGHHSPELLPGGQAVLYTVAALTGGLDAASLAVLDLRSMKSTILLRGGTHAQYVPSGHLVYAAGETLRAVGFDLTRLKIVGSSTPVVPHVLTTTLGVVNSGVARDGTLVYVAGAGESGKARTLVWVDRQGHETPIAAKPLDYLLPRVSPDGARLAVTVLSQKPDIWLLGLDRPTFQRVTSDSAAHAAAVWTRDGHRLVYQSNGAGGQNLFSQAADGSGPVVRLTESPNTQIPTDIAPDGTVVFLEQSSPTGFDVMAVALDGTHQVRPLVQTPFDERNGIVSPNGRWLAYEANDSGSFEIYVRPFPGAARAPSQVSTSGGTQPLWARDGRELFYFAPDGALMRVAVADGAAWSVGAPTKVLDGRYIVRPVGSILRTYDIAPDGRRFLMMKSVDATGTRQIVVVQHFDEELKRLVPVK